MNDFTDLISDPLAALPQTEARRRQVATHGPNTTAMPPGSIEQADDLADQLPRELYQPLLVGKIRSHGSARPMSLEQFVDAVAEREGVPPADAREHARTVLATLREAVSDREFADTLAQLPAEYRALLAPDE